MIGSGPNQEESVNSQRHDQFLNLKHKRDWEVSVHTMHTSRSQFRSGSHLSHEENTRSMQLEIDRLQRRLRHERWRKTPSNFDLSSNDDRYDCYKPRSRTPPNESFSYDESHHYKCRNKSPSRKSLGNDAMSRALNQISKSPFMRRIEGGKIPWKFTQPTFTMYNSRTNPVEYVSHFN